MDPEFVFFASHMEEEREKSFAARDSTKSAIDGVILVRRTIGR